VSEAVPDVLKIILSLPGNDVCADCGSTQGIDNRCHGQCM
jgi:hypothetical protein